MLKKLKRKDLINFLEGFIICNEIKAVIEVTYGYEETKDTDIKKFDFPRTDIDRHHDICNGIVKAIQKKRKVKYYRLRFICIGKSYVEICIFAYLKEIPTDFQNKTTENT